MVCHVMGLLLLLRWLNWVEALHASQSAADQVGELLGGEVRVFLAKFMSAVKVMGCVHAGWLVAGSLVGSTGCSALICSQGARSACACHSGVAWICVAAPSSIAGP
jgi:hypothetical protein